MNHKRGFTLVEILVVVAIIILVAVISMPTIRSMQASGARSQAFNTINAALQAARSYAIMNGVNTAARFQPNGKIFLVYRCPEVNGLNWNNGNLTPPVGPIYLPVLNQEPLRIPTGYAVADAQTEANRRPFFEPFYICYRPDGTLAVGEQIRVGLVDNDPTNPRPVNPTFNTTDFAWIQTHWINDRPSSYSPSGSSWKDWLAFSDNASMVGVPMARSLARFYNVARDNEDEIEAVVNETLDGKNDDYGPDHYAGSSFTGTYNPPGYQSTVAITLNLEPQITSQIAVFPTPENWDQLPLFSASASKTKQLFVDDCNTGILAEDGTGQTRSGSFERVFINPYTGRIIKPAE